LKESALESGMISWDIGEELYSAARSSLAAAAKATREPRRYFGNSAAYIAKRFLADAFMGQTEIGSFIVTACTPSTQRFFYSKPSEESAKSRMINPESRSGAEIIDKLDQIVTGVRGKLDEYKRTPNTEAFDEIVEDGFSYEMASALSVLARGGDGGIKITRTRASGFVNEKEIDFDAVESSVLEKVAVRFAATREPEQANLVGEVTLLDAPTPAILRVGAISACHMAFLYPSQLLPSRRYQTDGQTVNPLAHLHGRCVSGGPAPMQPTL
jgi:hypothetical protein